MSTDQARGEGSREGAVLWDTDLDQQPEAAPANRPPRDRAGVVLTAWVLIVLAAGAVTGALISPPSPPRPPPAVTMTVQDAYVTDRPVLAVRLSVGNADDRRARLTGLVVEGAGNRLVVPLDITVAPHGSAVQDVELTPKCPGGGGRPTAHAIAPSQAEGTVPVTLDRSLAVIDGLCDTLNDRLPAGWPEARRAIATRLEGQDLVVTVSDLSAERLAGILVDDALLPTVFVGDQLLTSTSARLTPGADTILRLKGPAPCIGSTAGVPVPTTMRLLAQGPDTLVQRMIVVGPELTRWVRLTCAKLESR